MFNKTAPHHDRVLLEHGNSSTDCRWQTIENSYLAFSNIRKLQQ